jgi:ubiquinone/menaquinone biosynthesis C-methylase UbiE/uncharacterized protein YbaR (Trm112 family)
MVHEKKIKKYLICANCKSIKLKKNNCKIICKSCNENYPLIYGIPILITKKKCLQLNLDYHKKNYEKNLLNNRNFKENKFGIIKHLNYVLMATSGFLYDKVNNIKKYPIAEIPFSKLNKNEYKKLLDVGCGWGRWTISSAIKGYESVGIDISISSLVLAKKISEKLNLKNCNFVCCDVLDLPLKENTFDRVFSFSFLQHFSESNLQIILKNVANKMKNNSIFKTQMVNKYAFRSIYNIIKIKYFEKKIIKNFSVRYFSIKKINKIFNQHFIIKNFENYSFFTQAQITDYKIMSFKSKFFLMISKILNTLASYFTFLKYISDNCIFILKKNNQKKLV